ncbi:MAG: dihydrolipoyl dehydrogenase [Nevskiales bacterium]
MSKPIKAKVLVIGGGPGGYVAAIRAGQLGLDTVLVEADRLGGTCLIRGCIPSKALIQVADKFEQMRKHFGEGAQGIKLTSAPQFDLGAAVRWKETVVDKLDSGVTALLKKAKVRTVQGWARFSDARTCTVETKDGVVSISAEHVILANGSRPTELPGLPFDDTVISSTETLVLDRLPARVVIVGAGYIGLELGIALRKMGAAVSFVEAAERILPQYDLALTRPVARWLKQHDVAVHLNSKARSLQRGSEGASLQAETATGEGLQLACDKLLVTVGRQPLTQGWGLENMAVDMQGAFIKVDDQCRTSMRNVWAIGDLVGEPMLAHKASAQGEMVAEIIAGIPRRFDPVAIPAVCFTDPEIVSVGLSPAAAKAKGHEVITGNFPFAANGRALSMQAGEDGGFVRVTARKDNHVVLGIDAVGAHASELSGEFVHALEMGASLEDIALTIHAHPTLSEALPEAALAALGHPIHI